MSIDKNAFDDEDDEDIYDESTILETGLPFKLYHGSRYLFDELRPFGIDFGNSFQDPGWSLFTWTKHASAMGWGCWEVFRHLSKIDDKIVLNGCLNSQTTVLWQSVYNYLKENIHKYSEKDLSFYVYTIPTRSEYEYGLGHSSNTPNCITIRTDHIKYSEVNKYILTIDLVDKYCKIVPDGYKPTGKEYGLNKRLVSFFMKYDYMYQPEVNKSINNAITNGEISPGDDISVFLKDNNIDLKTINFKERLDDIISNESTIMESVSPKIYFLSESNMDGKTLLPRIPSNYMTKNGYEESKTPRVCFSVSIDGSLMGLSQNLKDKELYVHIPESEVNIYKPSVKQVPDCKITGEVWVKDKVNIKCIGKIKVIKDKGLPGHRYMYGDGKSAELYDWDWKWEEKYSVNESVIIESHNPHYTYSKLSSQKEISDFKNSMKIVFNPFRGSGASSVLPGDVRLSV